MRNFREYLKEENLIGECLFFLRWNTHTLEENSDSTRYSVEVNFRSNVDQVLDNFAKIALGYVSAGIKQHNFHVKHVYTEKPVRILVSSRNWDDGEWVCVVSWNPEQKCFICSKGFYNKDRRTVSIQHSEKCGDTAAEITKHVYNMMHDLKGKPDRNVEPLKPAHLKPGPKS